VGRRLFKRTHRKIVLTDDGETLFSAVTMGFSHVQHALARLQQGENSQRLRISVDPDFAGLWLVPRLAEVYEIVPDTLVEIVAERTTPELHDYRVSCAIQFTEAGMDFVNAEMLFRSRLFPVCAKSLTQSAPLESLNDLRRHFLLHDRTVMEWEHYLWSCTELTDINLGVGVIFSDTAHCLDAAVRGQGVAIGDDFLAANYLAEGRLVRPFGPAMLSKNAYYFVSPPSALRRAAVKAFRMWLMQSIERQREHLRVH